MALRVYFVAIAVLGFHVVMMKMLADIDTQEMEAQKKVRESSLSPLPPSLCVCVCVCLCVCVCVRE